MKTSLCTVFAAFVVSSLALLFGCHTAGSIGSPASDDQAALRAAADDSNLRPEAPGEWTIPGLTGAQPKASTSVVRGHMKILELTPPRDDSRIRLGSQVPGRPEWRSWECTLRIWEFSFDDKTFAYVTYVVLGERNTTTGKDVNLGSVGYYEYRDDDGDGQLETRKGTMGPVVDPPRWAN